jgi:hypothetical protein
MLLPHPLRRLRMPNTWNINPKRCTVLKTGEGIPETVCFIAAAMAIDHVLNYGEPGDDLNFAGAPTTVAELIRQRDTYRMVYDNAISWGVEPESGSWAVYANGLHHFAGNYRECLNQVERLASTNEPVTICTETYPNFSALRRDARVFSGQIRHLHPGTDHVPLGVVEPITELR